MLRILQTLAFVFLAQGAGAQTMVMNTAEVQAFLDNVADRFQSVWRQEMRTAINAVPAYRGKADNLRLNITDTCDWTPNYSQDGDAPEVSLGKPLILLNQYLQQAYLFYFLDTPGAVTPQDITAYVRTQLVPILAREKDRCVRGREGTKSVFGSDIPSIYSGRMSIEAYRAKLAKLAGMPSARKVEDFVAGAPMMFVVLHETGHHMDAVGVPLPGADEEARADAFAIDLFARNKMSPTIAMSFFELGYQEAFARDAKRLACRMLKMVQSDAQMADAFAGPVSRDVMDRLEALNAYYRQEFAAVCDAP
ncbi:MAG: hypothetical protein AAF393_06895 [Pseudomonadota bacterium]